MSQEEQQASNRLDALVLTVGEVKGTVKSLDQKLDALAIGVGKLAEATAMVAKLEVHHETQSRELDRISGRLKALEDEVHQANLPALQESRKWLIGAMLFALTALGTALLGLVLVKT